MVNTKGLCAAIALFCVIVPLIVGHCMPIGSEEKTGYVSDNMVNITSDLANTTVPIYQEIISDNNNVPFIQMRPVEYDDVNSTIPALTSSNTNVTDTSAITISSLSNMVEYQMISDPFSMTYGGQTYSDIRVVYVIPDMYLVATYQNGDSFIIKASDYTGVTLTPTGVYNRYDFTNNGHYVNITKGGLFGAGANSKPIWANGFGNSRVGFLMEAYSNALNFNVTVSSETDSYTFGINYNNVAKWELQDNYPYGGLKLGDFKQVYLEIDNVAGEVRLSALTRSDSLNTSPEGRIIKTISISKQLTGDILAITSTLGSGYVKAVCYSADVNMGTQPVISNNTLSLDTYYQGKTTMTQFSGVAFYGDSLQLPGMASPVTVTDGEITYNDVGGDSHTTKIRESLLICEYDSDQNNYSVYYDDNLIAQNVAESDLDIVFGGDWLLNVYLRSASTYTYDEYIFSFSTLNITHNEYCFIGMGTAVIAFVIAAMVGKRSGEKATWCLLIAALGFAIYFGLMEI